MRWIVFTAGMLSLPLRADSRGTTVHAGETTRSRSVNEQFVAADGSSVHELTGNEWTWLSGLATHAQAVSACATLGAELPTPGEIAAAAGWLRDRVPAGRQGHRRTFWTNETWVRRPHRITYLSPLILTIDITTELLRLEEGYSHDLDRTWAEPTRFRRGVLCMHRTNGSRP